MITSEREKKQKQLFQDKLIQFFPQELIQVTNPRIQAPIYLKTKLQNTKIRKSKTLPKKDKLLSKERQSHQQEVEVTEVRKQWNDILSELKENYCYLEFNANKNIL